MRIEIFKIKSFPFLIVSNVSGPCLNYTIKWNETRGMKQQRKENSD